MAFGKIYSIVNQSSECCLCGKIRAMNHCASIETKHGAFIVCNHCAIKTRYDSTELIDPNTYQVNGRMALIVKRYIESMLNN